MSYRRRRLATVVYMNGPVQPSFYGDVLRLLGQFPPSPHIVNPRYSRSSATLLSLNQTCHQIGLIIVAWLSYNAS